MGMGWPAWFINPIPALALPLKVRECALQIRPQCLVMNYGKLNKHAMGEKFIPLHASFLFSCQTMTLGFGM
jgi:hypothetical protein